MSDLISSTTFNAAFSADPHTSVMAEVKSSVNDVVDVPIEENSIEKLSPFAVSFPNRLLDDRPTVFQVHKVQDLLCSVSLWH